MEKHIITGGPGSGKTSMVHHLAAQGYKIIPECARAIIEREQQREALDPSYCGVFPWNNLELFQEYYLAQQMGQEEALEPDGIYILDRSLVDPLAYAAHSGVVAPAGLEHYIASAGYDTVFYLEMVPESLYKQDPQRKESYVLALELSKRIHDAYTHLGFSVISVPFIQGVEKRAELVLRLLPNP